MQAVLLPIDDRPVTYTFPQMVARVAGVTVSVPPRNLLGSLQRPANPEALGEWMSNTLQKFNADAVLLCIDSFLYGGLISSRRGSETIAELTERASQVKFWRRLAGSNSPMLVQSSIMRISDNYDNTEEKQYWARYGREIFAWSALLHQLRAKGQSMQANLTVAEHRIPEDIRKDYLETRWRNFAINRKLLELTAEGFIDRIVFSLDDSGEFGLNVMEQQRLLTESQTLGLNGRVSSYAGADEVLCTLLSRWLVTNLKEAPRANVKYSSDNVATCESRYEGHSIGETIDAQIAAAGLIKTQNGGDFTVVVHGTDGLQGDHIKLPGHPEMTQLDTRRAVERTLKLIDESEMPCVLCDVVYANGGDPQLVEALLDQPERLKKLWGYAGWNTTGNTAGSALALGTARWAADRQGIETGEAFKEALFVRLADDWAYQAGVRSELKSPDLTELKAELTPKLQRIGEALDYHPERIGLAFPWNRLFEVEVAPGTWSG